MRALRILVVALVAALACTVSPGARAAAPAQRAMWVWDRPQVKGLVAFATRNGVQDLFVSVPTDLPTSGQLPWFRTLRTQASAAGIRVHALGSETTWIDDHAAALRWQAAALGTGLFDGVHLDVEPWLHPDWDGPGRDAVLGRYLDLLAASCGATALRCEADVAFWLDTVAVPEGRLDDAVLTRVDAVTVMSYRNTATGPDSITAVGEAVLAAAARAGKPARLAVETNDLGPDPVARKQTFWGFTQAQLSTALAAVDAAEAGAPAYAGVAVQDRAGWEALRRT
ncbi:hypothetical protein EKO23_22865 [Nocardioides guangzhouensis]|uniref:Uncharacterized protein n=1 Tax=Nocardioides guangzhouensis TaxID=2497878 RepID=A0A4Q4Z2J1_9ACTN|nr:hypothetical protein [Nocardioides guangzhouensis]RYP81867.1 hypothetical protein EKO23_22865 [Nocardioides guangzhouensis]